MDILTTILNPLLSIIDRLIPDKAQASQAKAQLLQLQVEGGLDELKGQIQTNITEAANAHVFVSGWRPFVGWACGAAFVYSYILQPLIQMLLVAFHSNFNATLLPAINTSDMMPVLLGMLGLGAMRSYDKAQGTGNGH